MKKLFLQLKRPLSASDLYRTLSPVKFLTPVLREYGIALICQYDYTIRNDLDAIVIQRHTSSELLTHLMERQHRGMRLAADWDDSMLDIPAWNPSHLPQHMRNEVIATRIVADAVWCSTKPLAATLAGWKCAKEKRALILPNLIDLDSWKGGDDHPEDEDTIRICWAGTETHKKDLELLEPVLDVILPKYPHVQFIYFGQVMPAWLLTKHFDRVHHAEWVSLNQYPAELRHMSPHIFLCPLVDEPFNKSKSAIKAFEATLAGAAVICSPVPPYQIEKEPIWGFAATTEEWVERISELVEDRGRRQRQHGRALEVVATNWSWQASKYRSLWLSAMLDLMGVDPEKPVVEEEKPVASGVADALKRMKGGS